MLQKAQIFSSVIIFFYASERIDSRLLKQSDQLADENRHTLCQIIRAVEFLAKQGLPFRGHQDDKVDFSCEDTNRGNYVAKMQLMAKGDAILSKHLCSARKNAKYTSKTIQNQILHIICIQNQRNRNQTDKRKIKKKVCLLYMVRFTFYCVTARLSFLSGSFTRLL